MHFPATDNTPLIRTHFADDAAWAALRTSIETPSADGFRAFVTIIDDAAFDGIDPATLAQPYAPSVRHALWIVADTRAMNDDDWPLLCIDTATGDTLRVIASELWGIENNLALANMDFAEFVRAAAKDGVFRGFG